MFVVQLRFTRAQNRAPQFMDDHNAWLRKGFEDGVFLLSGSIPPKTGGAIIVDGLPLDELQELLDTDPFVAEGIVTPEIVEISPGRADERLAFLVA